MNKISNQTKEKMKCECLANFDFDLAVKILELCPDFTKDKSELIKVAMELIDDVFRRLDLDWGIAATAGLQATLHDEDGGLMLELDLIPLNSFSFEKD